ncbi:MAG TPA: thioesterase family protein [Acidimicrobiales bacterium]
METHRLAPLDDDHLFEPDGHRWVPSKITAGPWAADALHGGPPTALVGRLMQAHDAGDSQWFLARLTTELIRPVPLAPLAVRLDVVRPGRRVQVIDAVVVDPDGTEVMWARGVRLVEQPNGVDESTIVVPEVTAWPAPMTCPSWTLSIGLPWQTFGDAFEFRLVAGRPFTEHGPASAWMRLRLPLFAGEDVHPLDRVLCASDFPNGIANVVPFERFVYVNPDLTVSLHRLPADDWILLDAATHVRRLGNGVARADLHDAEGALGTAIQSLLVTAR